jgi:hypothetical protein
MARKFGRRRIKIEDLALAQPQKWTMWEIFFILSGAQNPEGPLPTRSSICRRSGEWPNSDDEGINILADEAPPLLNEAISFQSAPSRGEQAEKTDK